MNEDETIDSFARRLMSIITKAATCGLTFDEQTKVRKLLNAVPDKFVPIVATIEMVVDFKKAKLEEVIGKLKTYEERLKFRKGSEEDNSEKLLFTRQGNNRNYERNYGNERRGGENPRRDSTASSVGMSPFSLVALDKQHSSSFNSTLNSLEAALLESHTDCAALVTELSSSESPKPHVRSVEQLAQKLESMQKLLFKLQNEV
ncbi:zinc finger, CCHC-type [Artemisia annua]|uniref:Zinc finger, CCHC-type n=1 Tax=Artemisia annua TaxID=35608 RepID=A0A2U1NL45_ARTAN|nr:zinc finger, CCHC-type [Artemisia annua]